MSAVRKCYLCRNALGHDGDVYYRDDSWYLTHSDSIPFCTKCSKLVARKFRAWVRSLRKPVKKKKKKKKR